MLLELTLGKFENSRPSVSTFSHMSVLYCVHHTKYETRLELTFGNTQAISCDEGYHLCDDCTDIATCTGTSYDTGPVTCVKEEHCDPYLAPVHSTVTPGGNVTEGNCVHIQCDPGYLYDNMFAGKSDP